jgi:NHLM bacteriocin system ABC transporter ATP-binding protein
MSMRLESQESAPADHGAALAALFAGAERVQVGGDRPFLLLGENAWYVAAGQVDVFVVSLDDGEPVGPRQHFVRLQEGCAAFGAQSEGLQTGRALLAVGANGTSLLRQGLSALAHQPLNALAPLVEPWIEGLSSALARDLMVPVSVELGAGAETKLEAGQSLRLLENCAFVRVLDGACTLVGRDLLDVPSATLLPMSRRAWLVASQASRVSARATASLPDQAALWSGLAALQMLALRGAGLLSQARDVAAGERLRQKSVQRDNLLRDSCERLAATMSPDVAVTPTVAEGDVEALSDPLFAACVKVGERLALKLRPYVRAQGSPAPRDPLAAILRASRLRSRQVALRGRWWNEDNGPMLARFGPDKAPVALLPRSDYTGYLLYDPRDRSTRRVDASVGESLEPFAHSFYRPFADQGLDLRTVLRFGLHGCRRDIWILVGVSLCATLLGMVPSMATGMLFNTVIPGAQRSELLQMTCVLLACAAASACFTLGQNIAMLRIEGRMSSSIQAGVWDRLLGLPLSFFRPYTSGDLAMRAMSIDGIRQAVSGATTQALFGAFVSLGNFCLMYWYSWKMALWGTLIITIVLILAVSGSALQLRPQRQALLLTNKASGLVLQLLSSIGKLRVAGVEVAAFAMWVRRFSEQRRHQYEVRAIGNWVAAFNSAVPVLSYAVIFYFALPLVAETRTLGTGDFLAFLAAFSSCSTALLGAALALLATLNTIPLYEQAKPILEALPEVNVGKADPGVLTGDLEVQHALFRYQADGPLILRDVSFHIRPGEFVAFVGPSGSGKSTLLRLLLGFETLEAGAIYYDGQELAGLDIQAVRRQMGVVLQSGRLMSGDIFTNIVGSASAVLDEAWEAARMAGLADDINAMPMGMHTVISEGGGTLSGGQRQRLLIARAIVSKPRLLLFDEATSALDNRTQAIVSASLERLQATRIVVAHRLSTIVNADRIMVMERGRLVQSGSYSELMAQKGPFAELAKRQIA